MSRLQQVKQFLAEIGRRLTGVPRFVLNDALNVYKKAKQDTKKQGCTESGLVLASLEYALLKHQLEHAHARPALCEATAGKVDARQLDVAARVVARQTADTPLLHTLPPCAYLAQQLCSDLLRASKERGKRDSAGRGQPASAARDQLWAKAACAAAEYAGSNGFCRDQPVLTLAAALALFIFERHTPKTAPSPKQVAESAGLREDAMLTVYVELLPHMEASSRLRPPPPKPHGRAACVASQPPSHRRRRGADCRRVPPMRACPPMLIHAFASP